LNRLTNYRRNNHVCLLLIAYITSQVNAILWYCAGRPLVRINLSEQTDMMDLLGADLPSVSGNAGQFAWCDGPLLAALKAGHWVLLDELNLAGKLHLSLSTLKPQGKGFKFAPRRAGMISSCFLTNFGIYLRMQ
jgi:hypothetical protein